ncbi:hydantoinase/oxoprolinase family protein [Desulfoscipio gibsoniae]|uniref:N-methylhydantoinase A/acetone carboxylase, beta subunit n=1 Tax=Desulfoscipio gibsoniae DSM 7213 TaxID=767817 RepID=R4KRI6_9FIRM|nr:hydantoinase/oxoprolinase family protein [Desulfoscipio gibsoniae]AGL03185.1 N-methylhydantoinase A/acetone carboxylase, beta subunit [Desulfoscipio gibsoniae DSM 7213]
MKNEDTHVRKYFFPSIGVDTGGTFTDVVIVDVNGNVAIGKSATTPKKLEDGVLNALKDACEKSNFTLDNVLPRAMSFKQGTTIGTNIMINRNGAKTGLITTKGFEDTLHFQRGGGRVAGLQESEIRHQAVCRKPEPLVPKSLIYGVTERVDCFAKVIIPLNEEEVVAAVKELVGKGVEAIAVCLLWSFANPVHEKRIRQIIKEIAPEVYVQISSEVAPVIKEYGRMNTVAIDTYVGPPMIKWYEILAKEIKSRGHDHELLTMQAWGGVMPYSEMSPIGTINSGPAGGVLATKFLAENLGFKNVVATDVGGTSFEASVIAEWRPVFHHEPLIMRYRVETPMVEIRSIGAGGGTIAWADDSGRLRVGPVSAGADPGPVCYQIGGTQPTVTDADLLLGYLNDDYFLGGKMRLDKAAALEAYKELGTKVGMDPIEAAAGVFDIQNAHMSDMLRGVVTQRGHDPKDFVVFCFGGGGPLHGSSYGKELGFSKIYMFQQSSVFSAYGIALTDIESYVNYFEHHQMPIDPEVLSSIYKELEEKAYAKMAKMGYDRDMVDINREICMKFGRQVHIETIPIDKKDHYTIKDVEKIYNDFLEHYQKVYGEGAGFVEAGVEVLSYVVRPSITSVKPMLPKHALGTKSSKGALKGKRPVYFSEYGEFRETNIYDYDKLTAGNVIEGAGIIETSTTTMLILPSQVATVDEYLNVVIEG